MLKRKIRSCISTMIAAVSLSAMVAVPAFASVNAGGGVWDYGTKVVGVNKKMAYSNYYHSSEYHKSTASVGTNAVTSSRTRPGATSYASATGGWLDVTHAYYSIY